MPIEKLHEVQKWSAITQWIAHRNNENVMLTISKEDISVCRLVFMTKDEVGNSVSWQVSLPLQVLSDRHPALFEDWVL